MDLGKARKTKTPFSVSAAFIRGRVRLGWFAAVRLCAHFVSLIID